MPNLADYVDAANERNEEVLKVATKLCDTGGVDGSTCRALLDAIGATANAILEIDSVAALKAPKDDHYAAMMRTAKQHAQRHQYKTRTVKSVLDDLGDTLEIAVKKSLRAWVDSTPSSQEAYFHLGQVTAIDTLINHLREVYNEC